MINYIYTISITFIIKMADKHRNIQLHARFVAKQIVKQFYKL